MYREQPVGRPTPSPSSHSSGGLTKIKGTSVYQNKRMCLFLEASLLSSGEGLSAFTQSVDVESPDAERGPSHLDTVGAEQP